MEDRNSLEVLKRLKEAKISRKQAEDDLVKLNNRINRIRQKQISSEKKIEILRDVSLKVKKIRQDKAESSQIQQQHKKMVQEFVEQTRDDIKTRNIEGLAAKESNTMKILQERKNNYLAAKEKIKNNEEFVKSRLETCAELNALAKNEIFLRKDQILKQREFESIERKMKARQDFGKRVTQERLIVEKKMFEKNLMLDVDLGVIESLQSNKFF